MIGDPALQHLVNIHFFSRDMADLLKHCPAMLYFVFNSKAIVVLVAHNLQEGEMVAQVSAHSVPPITHMLDERHYHASQHQTACRNSCASNLLCPLLKQVEAGRVDCKCIHRNGCAGLCPSALVTLCDAELGVLDVLTVLLVSKTLSHLTNILSQLMYKHPHLTVVEACRRQAPRVKMHPEKGLNWFVELGCGVILCDAMLIKVEVLGVLTVVLVFKTFTCLTINKSVQDLHNHFCGRSSCQHMQRYPIGKQTCSTRT